MALFRVLLRVQAPPQRLWDLLAEWEGQAEWMVDATTVEVLGAQREGVGTRIRAVTRVAGVPIADEMTVSRWEPPRVMEVRHTGRVIRGVAWWEMRPHDGATLFEWAEELDPPLGPLGEIGATVLRRPIEALLRRSARKLAAAAEAAEPVPR